MFYPGSRIRGVKKHRIPDPTSFCIKAINKFCLLIPDPDPTIAPSRIPDPGGKKAPDPGSGSATLLRLKCSKFCRRLPAKFSQFHFLSHAGQELKSKATASSLVCGLLLQALSLLMLAPFIDFI
jgi:hypothetical protein